MIGFVAFVAIASVPVTADTARFVVLNHGRDAGEMIVVSSDDSVAVRYHHFDRQRGPRVETRYRMRGTLPVAGETWQLPLYGPRPDPLPAPSDRFEIVRDSVFWRQRDEPRSSVYAPGSFHRLRSQTPFDQWLLVRYLLDRPDRTARVLPGQTARVEIVGDTVLRTGAAVQRLRWAVVHGLGPNPSGVWIDERGTLVASEVGWFITVRRGSESILPALRGIELKFRNANGAALARRLMPRPAPAVAVVNGDVFDTESGTMLPRRTVVIRGDRIVAVGSPDSVAIPAGAVVVEAAGRTVLPGMWDMHTHSGPYSQTTGGLGHLAIGVTTIRDMAADLDVATQLRDRVATGDVLGPRVILAGFIEGPGKWAGPTEVIVRTEDEARAWIARYDSLGYRQIKLYNLVQQDLVPAIAEEAKRRGLRLSGHVPRGLTTPAAVRLGFDEINHAAFLFSTFFQDSLYLPQMRAYSTVSQIVAPNVDVDGPEVTAMIQLFRERGTVIDGTWNLWMSTRTAASTAVGIPQTPDALSSRLDASYLRMLKRLFDAGVPIVPGTDGSSYNVELELYERAGIPAPDVLRLATLGSARVMGDDRDYGSIAPGKVADLIIVDGNPAQRVADLRRVERVIRAGRVYEVRALRSAFPPAPQP